MKLYHKKDDKITPKMQTHLEPNQTVLIFAAFQRDNVSSLITFNYIAFHTQNNALKTHCIISSFATHVIVPFAYKSSEGYGNCIVTRGTERI